MGNNMNFNMDDLNPSTRCFFNEEKPEEGYVDLRILNQEAHEAINEKVVKKRFDFHNHVRHEVKDVNSKMRDELNWDYCITEWDIKDANGQQIPCTIQNKAKLMRGSMEFNIFVSKKIEALNNALLQRAEELEKNS